jgi:hypothetical protein
VPGAGATGQGVLPGTFIWAPRIGVYHTVIRSLIGRAAPQQPGTDPPPPLSSKSRKKAPVGLNEDTMLLRSLNALGKGG